MRPVPLLLDTCAAIFISQGRQLNSEGGTILTAAAAEGWPVYLSPITAWEVGLLVSRGRLSLATTPLVWFQDMIEEGIDLAEMPPAVLIDSAFLPGSVLRDPADRIIAATARAYGFTVVTRDGPLLDYAKAGHLKAVAC